MGVLVDTNIILDVVTDDPDWAEWSSAILASRRAGELIVNPMIFSELCVGAESADEVVEILNELGMTMHDLSLNALFEAAQAFKRYRMCRGNKRSPLPDFFIGAQAADEGWALITRDGSRYRTYFPGVELICPV